MALRIPKVFADKVRLQHNALVDVSIIEGKLVVAPIVVKKRGVIVQILDRFVEARVRREQKGVIFRAKRAKKT